MRERKENQPRLVLVSSIETFTPPTTDLRRQLLAIYKDPPPSLDALGRKTATPAQIHATLKLNGKSKSY
jgi:hypothetical protein